jgi:HemY protein
VRALIAFLLIAAAAVTLALLFRLNTGYVLFVAPPYRVELSQNAFIIIAVLAFLALYALVRASVRLSRLPAEVRESRRRRQFERFRSKQDAAVVALIEGRHGKARQFAQEALAIRTRHRSPRSSVHAPHSRRATMPPRPRCSIARTRGSPSSRSRG